MGDELVDLQFASHVVVDKVGELRATFDTSERAAFPDAAGDKLEGWSGISSTKGSERVYGKAAYV